MKTKRKYDYQLVLNYIIDYKSTHDGNSPSYRNIMEAIGITSLSVVDYILKRMMEQNLIKLEEGTRAIQVVGGQWIMP